MRHSIYAASDIFTICCENNRITFPTPGTNSFLEYSSIAGSRWFNIHMALTTHAFDPKLNSFINHIDSCI